MDEQKDTRVEEDTDLAEMGKPVGTGRKVGIYAIIFIVVAILILTILTLSGFVKNPFLADPGVGP